jgi:hypothetical protein
MAIRVLLDHNVPEDKIALLSLLVSKQGLNVYQSFEIIFFCLIDTGVQTIAYVFPKVKIVTTACDTQLDQVTGFICPGLGNFGDRYFGTDLMGDTSDTDDVITSTTFRACSPHSPSPGPKKPLDNHDSNFASSVVLKSFDPETLSNGDQ